MKRLGLTAILLASAAVVAQADFDGGMQAYERGDFAAAFQAWQPLAETGDAQAQYYLYMLYEGGHGVARDADTAKKWLRKSAKQGYGRAQYVWGHEYLDPVQGFEWVRRAAKQGVAEAQCRLGNAYAMGHFVPRDDNQASAWIRKAAAQEASCAFFALAEFYYVGSGGIAQDYDEAARWYEKAARHGQPLAQLKLAMMLHEGQGVARNDVRALLWLSVPHEFDSNTDYSTHQVLISLRAMIAQGMSDEQVLQARELTRQLSDDIHLKPPRRCIVKSDDRR